MSTVVISSAMVRMFALGCVGRELDFVFEALDISLRVSDGILHDKKL